MNNKITFQRLASLVADKSGRSKRFSEDFLREFFTLIAEQLETGGSVKVKGLGTFRLIRVEPRKSVDVTTGQPMEISGHSKVVFTPAKDLAEAVNAPFQAFSAVEIGNDVDISGIVDGDDIDVDVDSEEIALAGSPDEVPLFYGMDMPSVPVAPAAQQEVVGEADSILDETASAAGETVFVSEEPASSADEFGVDGSGAIEDVEEDISTVAAEEASSSADNVDNVDEVDNADKTDDAHGAGRGRDVVVSDRRSYDDADDDDGITIIEGGRFGGDNDSRHPGTYGNYGNGLERRWSKSLLIGAVCAVAAVVITFIIWSVATKPVFMEAGNEDVALADFGGDADEELSPGDIDPVDAAVDADTLPDDGAGESSAAGQVPTAPSDVVVYDTIGKTRYLTTMAKAHYGSNKFWPYIYEENKGNIGHPDKIRPGTPIVIPKLSKYGVDPDNPADVEKANKLAVEIYARYGKSI